MQQCKICGSTENIHGRMHYCKECKRRSKLTYKRTEPDPVGIVFTYRDSLRYIVTDKGEVFSIKYLRFLKQHITKTGYSLISFGSHSKDRKFYLVHRLVAYCYGLLDNINSPLCVDHIDGDKQNNNLANLRAVTHGANEIYKNQRTKGFVFAYKDGVRYGPFSSVRDLYEKRNLKALCTLSNFYTAVAKKKGYGYTYTRENI